MHLRNFQLRFNQGVEVVAVGHNWDLHNFATLTAVHYDAARQVCELEWTAPSVPNPWGDPSNDFAGCRLRFSGVSRCESEGDPVEPGAVLAEIATVSPDGRDEPFDIWLSFESGTLLKLGGEEAELLPLARAA